MGTYYYIRFAQAYGQGNYGSCVYNDATSCQTSGGGGSTGTSNGSSSGSQGGLSNTGLLLIVVISVACLIAFVAMVIRFWRRPRKELATETAPADDQGNTPQPPTVA